MGCPNFLSHQILTTYSNFRGHSSLLPAKKRQAAATSCYFRIIHLLNSPLFYPIIEEFERMKVEEPVHLHDRHARAQVGSGKKKV